MHYSIWSLINQALTGNRNWAPVWRDPEPKSHYDIVIVGGGVIGLELGSVYKRLGADVSVVEYADSLIPAMDAACGKELQRTLRKLGMNFHMSTKVEKVSRKGETVIDRSVKWHPGLNPFT